MTIPENSVVFNRNISIGGGSPCDPLRLVQYDDTLPILAATLWLNGAKYTPPSGATVRIRWHKADDMAAYNPALGVGEDGTVYIQITQQMTAAAGVGFGNIEITTDAGVKNSDAIPFVVAKNAVQEGQIESGDEWLTVDEILKRVEALQAKVEQDASTASTDAQRAETAREATETAAETVKQIVAGNEAWTKQESNDRFALALKTDTGKGTSHEIYPDEGSNIVVTAYGYTEQEGDGDPSPENVRPIKVAGFFDSLLDPSLLYPGVVAYDFAKNTLCRDPVSNYNFDIFNGTFGTSGKREKYLQLHPSTKYVISADSIPTNISVYSVANDGSIAKLAALAASSGGVPPYQAQFTTTETGRITLIVYGGYYLEYPNFYIRPVDGSEIPFRTHLTNKGDNTTYAMLPITEPLCSGDYVVSNQDGQCVEVHDRAHIVISSDNFTANDGQGFIISSWDKIPKVKAYTTDIIFSHFTISAVNRNPANIVIAPSKIDPEKFPTASSFLAYCDEQKASGTPVQMVALRAKDGSDGYPSTFDPTYGIHTYSPVSLIANPDATGKVTVSGEKEVSAIYNKSLKKAFEELSNAILKLGGAQNV